MNVQVRMYAALALVCVTVTGLVVDGHTYFHNLHLALITHHPVAHTTPPLLLISSLCGLVAWLLVVFQQWRERQIGWIVASFLLSYLAIITYAILTLFRARRPVADAEA
jgi:cytochrome bd-type quinol oxidase subunit 2